MIGDDDPLAAAAGIVHALLLVVLAGCLVWWLV